MPKILKYSILIILTVAIIAIRFFENELFYDPLINYYKTDFLNSPLPNLNILKLISSYTLRYLLNTILSIAILLLFFNKKNILQFCIPFYTITFVLLLTSFLVILAFFSDNVHLLFNIRRFIMQPLFILLLIPAFYYQNQQIDNN